MRERVYLYNPGLTHDLGIVGLLTLAESTLEDLSNLLGSCCSLVSVKLGYIESVQVIWDIF